MEKNFFNNTYRDIVTLYFLIDFLSYTCTFPCRLIFLKIYFKLQEVFELLFDKIMKTSMVKNHVNNKKLCNYFLSCLQKNR